MPTVWKITYSSFKLFSREKPPVKMKVLASQMWAFAIDSDLNN